MPATCTTGLYQQVSVSSAQVSSYELGGDLRVTRQARGLLAHQALLMVGSYSRTGAS